MTSAACFARLKPSETEATNRETGGFTTVTATAGPTRSIAGKHHPGCAYPLGRREAANAIRTAAPDAATTSRDFGRGFTEAAKVAEDYLR